MANFPLCVLAPITLHQVGTAGYRVRVLDDQPLGWTGAAGCHGQPNKARSQLLPVRVCALGFFSQAIRSRQRDSFIRHGGVDVQHGRG